ncbi:MAG: hypothetical protein LPJ98_10165, partial [Cyclobacteriaceae bacterium]|nr:hypothetical protein [Cyclobacteriaceae bacterium]
MVAVDVNISIKPYSPDVKKDWDMVLDNSINGTFLHRREFIEYHGDRFEDASVILYYKNRPVAIFPANKVDNRIFSHQGLSYAGLIVIKGVTFSKQKAIIEALLEFFRMEGAVFLEIKFVPSIYCKESQDSLEYLWMQQGAKMAFSDLTYAIPHPSAQLGRTKRWKIRKSHLRGIEVRLSNNFKAFWEELLAPNLMERFGLQPAHSLQEIIHLNTLFPDSIKLFLAIENHEILGGTCLFITERVTHAQYIATSAKGKKYRALDYLFNHLIHHEFKHLA